MLLSKSMVNHITLATVAKGCKDLSSNSLRKWHLYYAKRQGGAASLLRNKLAFGMDQRYAKR